MLIFLHDVLTGAQLVHRRDRQWKLKRCSASVLEETKRKASLDDSGTISKSRKFEQMPQKSTPVGVCARVCVCVCVCACGHEHVCACRCERKKKHVA